MKKQTPEIHQQNQEDIDAELSSEMAFVDFENRVREAGVSGLEFLDMDEQERREVVASRMEGLTGRSVEVEPVTDGNSVEVQFDSEETPVEVHSSEA